MPEGPNPGPARRGKKDPALAQRLMLDESTELLSDAHENVSDEITLLDEGDTVMARYSQEHRLADGSEAWFSSGVVTRVRTDEDDDDVYDRASTFVYGAVHAQINQAEESILAALQERRTRRITPNEN